MSFPKNKYVRRPNRFQYDNQHSYDVAEDTANIVNGGISYGNGTDTAHIDCSWAFIADTGVANTEFSVNHNLGRIPVGFHVASKNKASDFYESGTPWTNKQIFLKAVAANVAVRFIIF